MGDQTLTNLRAAFPPKAPVNESQLRSAALLSFLDGVDRLNTLLLEIRQLQTTLIHQLRAPGLLEPLQYEENFLWGTRLDRSPPSAKADFAAHTSWLPVFEVVRNIHDDSVPLSRCWVARYPHPRDLDGQKPGDRQVGARNEPEQILQDVPHLAGVLQPAAIVVTELTRKMGRLIGEDGRRGFLTAELRRLYHIMTSLQILKQNLLREKIVLTYYGLRAFGEIHPHEASAYRTDDALHLLMAAIAVRHQLAYRVPSLGNLQRQIEQFVEPAFDLDPRPVASRRRDQGMFSIAVVDRIRGLHADLKTLLGKVAIEERHMQDGRDGILMHRWDVTHSSRQNVERDAVMANMNVWDPQRPSDKAHYTTVANVISSYWMPDRPDLWPQLAHELAHVEINNRLGKFRSTFLAHTPGPFGALLKSLKSVMERTREIRNRRRQDWQLDNNTEFDLLHEIAADLLACAVSGPSYGYMAMLDFMGGELEQLFQSEISGDEVDFRISFDKAIYGNLDRLVCPQLWLMRNRCIVALLEMFENETEKHRRPVLADQVSAMLTAATDAILNGLRRNASLDRRQWLAAWDEMTIEMARVIGRKDGVAFAREAAKNYNLPAHPDDHSDAGRWEAGMARALPLGALFDRLLENPRRLHGRVVKAYPGVAGLPEVPPAGGITVEQAERAASNLKLKIVTEATDKSADGAFTKAVRELFCWHYLNLDTDRLPDTLFANVYDIPWQAAILSVADLLPARTELPYTLSSSGTGEAWLRAAERMNLLGREYFHLGLEFRVWNDREVRTRLEACVRVVRGLVADIVALQWIVLPDFTARQERLQSALEARPALTAPRVRPILSQIQDRLDCERSRFTWDDKSLRHLRLYPWLESSAEALAGWLHEAQALAMQATNNWGAFGDLGWEDILRKPEWDKKAAVLINRLHVMYAEPPPVPNGAFAGLLSLLADPGNATAELLAQAIRERIASTANAACPRTSAPPAAVAAGWLGAIKQLRASITDRWRTLLDYSGWAEHQDTVDRRPSARRRHDRNRHDLYTTICRAMGGVGFPEGPNADPAAPGLPLTTAHAFRIERISFHTQFPPGEGVGGPLVSLGTTPWVDHTDLRSGPSVDLAEATPFSVAACVPLLGRYDMIRIKQARPTDPLRLPDAHVADWEAARHKGYGVEPGAAPFFVRQQFGLRFSPRWKDGVPGTPGNPPPAMKDIAGIPDIDDLCAQTGWCNAFGQCFIGPKAAATPADQESRRLAIEGFTPLRGRMQDGRFMLDNACLPIAVISLQLAQRSARLTLVRQLLEEDAAWSAFGHDDYGFLIDGWGDILLVFQLDLTPLQAEIESLLILPGCATAATPASPQAIASALKRLRRAVARRVKRVIDLRDRLYGHFLVNRTESAFVPIVADAALGAMMGEIEAQTGGNRLRVHPQFRAIPDRVTGDVIRHIETALSAWIKRRGLKPHAVELLSQAGAYDYNLRFRPDPDLGQYLNGSETGGEVSQVQALSEIHHRLAAAGIRPELPANRCGLLYASAYARLISDAFDGAHHLVDKIQTIVGLEVDLGSGAE